MKNKNVSEKVIEFILTRSNDELADLTIQKMTCKLKISRSHLYHLFKNEMKFTPGDYLMMIKMLRSANLLVENHTLPIEKLLRGWGFPVPIILRNYSVRNLEPHRVDTENIPGRNNGPFSGAAILDFPPRL